MGRRTGSILEPGIGNGTLRNDELLNRHNVKVRIDIQQPLLQNLAFRTSDRRVQGQKLPVAVGYRNLIAVKNENMAYSGTDNHLRSIAAHTAYTDYGHPGG